MKKAITISAEWIREVKDGRCNLWNYYYKEYIYNDQYTDAYILRIPQNANGIKAIEFSSCGGIEEEYSIVYLDNNGNVEKIFDVNEKPDLKDEQIKILLMEIETLKSEKKGLQCKLNAIYSILNNPA